MKIHLLKKEVVSTFRKVLEKIIQFIRKPIFKAGISLFIIIFVAVYIFLNFQDFSSILREININYTYLTYVFILVLLTVFIGTITWWLILAWLSFQKNIIGVIRGYAISSLAKYIPGFVWQYASRSVFLETYNIPIKTIAFAIGVEFILVTSLGGILSCLSYLVYGHQLIELLLGYKILISILLFLLILLILFLPRLITLAANDQDHIKNIRNKKLYIYAVIVNFSGWLLMSWAFLFLSKSVGINNFNYSISLFLHSTNFFISNVFLFIPNGLVIREAIIVYLAKALVNQHMLILTSLLMRTLIFIAEVFLTLTLLLLPIKDPTRKNK